MERIKVALSPFYTGEAFVDELTNITFEPNPRGLSVYSIPAELDLTNIKRFIRLNILTLVEGNIGEYNEVVETVVEAKEVVQEKAPAKAEEVVEAKAEGIAEEKVEAKEVKPAPKKASRKKPTKTEEK